MVSGANGVTRADVRVTLDDVDAIARHTTTLDIVAASVRAPLAETGGDLTQQVWALTVSPRFFEMLPPDLVAGRGLVADDATNDATAPELTAVLSERYWRAHFNGNPALNTLTLELNRRPARVVGVMQDGFQTPTGVFEPDLWLTIAAGKSLGILRGDDAIDSAIGFIATATPGVPAAAIAQDLRQILSVELGQPEANIQVAYEPIINGHPEMRAMRPVAAVALAAVGIVLLIACFNVAGLLLAQSAERQRELGMRAALGASRPRLIRQVLTDGLVLSTLAGAASLILAAWSSALLSTFSLPAPIPQRLHIALDWRLITFAIGLSLVAALLPALVPAWQVWRADLTAWIRSGSAGGSGSRAQTRARRSFLVLQVAGSTVFVIASAVFAETFIRARAADPGFDTIHTAAMEVNPAYYGYTPVRTRQLVTALTATLKTTPGVVSVSAADRIPFFVGYPLSTTISVDGRDCRTIECPRSEVMAADSHHAAAMGLTLRVGRWFDSESLADRDAVVINQAVADKVWPDVYPIGHTFRDADGRSHRVVGVVANLTTNLMVGRTAVSQPALYQPLGDENFARPLTIVLKTHDSPDAFVDTLRRALHDVAPDVPPQSIGTMQQRMALPLWPARTLAGFFGVCGLLALILATVGLFGVTHYVVSQRQREFGVRLAIGASDGLLQRMVVGETLRLIAPGLVIGLAGGIALDRLIKSQLTGLDTANAGVLAGALAIEMTMAVLAAWLPARRAGRTNPLEALRAE
jgi:putative ABC transport system permease protein